MSSMIELVKRASVEAVAASKPMMVSYGTLQSLTPIVIVTDQKLQLEDVFSIWTESMKQKTLKVGDKLLLLQVQGGQKYVVLDRYV